jgi:hypothetical protein
MSRFVKSRPFADPEAAARYHDLVISHKKPTPLSAVYQWNGCQLPASTRLPDAW